MTTLAHVVRNERPNQRLMFRKTLYGSGEEGQLIADVLALANAETSGRRYLFLGVETTDGDSNRLVGVDRKRLASFRRHFRALVDKCIEPELAAAVRAVEVDNRLIGYVRIDHGDDRPYLARRSLGESVRAGQGFIRRGSRNFPLRRSDLKRMFSGEPEPFEPQPAIRIGFAGEPLASQLTLPALSATRLPSELAAERLKSMLEMHDVARERFGQTQTQLSRLMHAKLYGAEVPFEKHSDDSLVGALQNVSIDYSAADAHYLYEVRAHRLNLVVSNDTDDHLHAAELKISVPIVEGTGIADRVYLEDLRQPQSNAGYPQVVQGSRAVTVTAEVGTVFANRSANVFREPLRFYARPSAAGKAVPLDYRLSADELDRPVSGTLIVYVEKTHPGKA